ncbi:MAG: proton-conducting membrane transporter [Eubacterium sp.]|nr:proton-conducting membrane transporter [Eubacterium sp.]
MATTYLLLAAVFLPFLWGAGLLLTPVKEGPEALAAQDKRAAAFALSGIVLTGLVTLALIVLYAGGEQAQLTLLTLTGSLRIRFALDGLGVFFLCFIPVIWLLSGIYSLEYLKHEDHRKRFWGFYLLTLGTLQGLSLSGDLVTMYLFFELMTLVSMPLVLHTQSHEAVMAALKYLLYSMAGAFMALFGIFVFYQYGGGTDFTAGGVVDAAAAAENGGILHLGVFLMILGFGVKAGMFPMHAWLPTAHPVAPSPASAVLSAIIVKGGVLAILRSVFYAYGAELIRGTWVQTAWLILACFTVFMGSMLAYNEQVFKKRLAYSSVSQASYVLLGLASLDSVAMTGALLHVLFHAIMKTALFLTAGTIIYKTGKTRVDELTGIGKEMPVTMWCFTFASLSLVGIPPASGFISKWYLATGLLDSGLSVFRWLGPVILLVSALLTAGYLLPITIHGFLPGNDYDYTTLEKKDPNLRMLLPLFILAALAILTGVFPGGIVTRLLALTQAML